MCSRDNPDRLDDARCRNLLYVNSIQAYWQKAYPELGNGKYEATDTNFFQAAVNTGCGQADSGVGPFYCPADRQVYIDLSFYDELATRFGAKGEFAQPYVLAHEYGHHIQNLLGTNAKAGQGDQSGPRSASVRLELQADCYAGAWAKHATESKDKTGQEPLFKSITETDISEAVDRPPRRSATTASRSAPAGRSTPTSSPTARPSSASAGSPRATTAATRRPATPSAPTSSDIRSEIVAGPSGPATIVVPAEAPGQVEPRDLVVADEPVVVDPPHEHAEVDGQGRPVGEAELHLQVAEDHVVGETADLPDVVRGGQAERLSGVVRGDAGTTDRVRLQPLKDRVVGEARRDPIGLVGVDCRFPPVEDGTQNLRLGHDDLPADGRVPWRACRAGVPSQGQRGG